MDQEKKLQELLNQSKTFLIVQPDNPDGDSLASALALEDILSSLDKTVHLYCGTQVPKYLRYVRGWDRVHDELPAEFDASIIVDTASSALLEHLNKEGGLAWLKAKPSIVLDHHTKVQSDLDFVTLFYLKPAVSTGELIYELCSYLKMDLSRDARDLLTISIMSDSLGLTSEETTSRSIAIISKLVEAGVSIPSIEKARRAFQKKSPEILAYKAELISRISYSDDQRIASVIIPWKEIEKYSNEYNPSVLVLDEMRLIDKVAVAVAFKTYRDGKVTAKIRTNHGYGIAADLALHFGGGGHSYAAGFKVLDGTPVDDIKDKFISLAKQLIDTLDSETDEDIQYTYTVG